LYDDGVTVDDVLIQYQNRLHELQTGLHQLRLPHALTAFVLVIALVMAFTLSLSAIRGQISFLWPPVPILVAGAFAAAFSRIEDSDPACGG
jgi:integral membrane sensor domain MASE1